MANASGPIDFGPTHVRLLTGYVRTLFTGSPWQIRHRLGSVTN